LGEISGADRVHYCGAYWRWGFHEDGCWSAVRACEPLLAAARIDVPDDLERAAGP
jgi:predicted NAD/FAD-binding protein